MKKYILNICLLGCLGLLISCNDLDGKYDELVPDEYHKILSIKETGSQEVIMSVEEEVVYARIWRQMLPWKCLHRMK